MQFGKKKCRLRQFNFDKLYFNSRYKSKRYDCLVHNLHLSWIRRSSTLVITCSRSSYSNGHAGGKCSVSYLFSETCNLVVVSNSAHDNDSCCRLVQHLKLSPAQLFDCHTLYQAMGQRTLNNKFNGLAFH